jgi:hypothetical protein
MFALIFVVFWVGVLANEDREWVKLKDAATSFTDFASIHIGPSTIHGRGVIATKNIPAGRISFLNYFALGPIVNYSNIQWGLTHGKGYIPEGSDIKIMGNTRPVDAANECNQLEKCIGFTFSGIFNDSNDFKGTMILKGKGNVIEFEGWHSFTKASKSFDQVYFPVPCGPMLTAADRDRASDKNVIACAARLVNHNCNATCESVMEDVGNDFVIPGLPWSGGREIKAMYLHAKRDLVAGDELSLDYNTIPYVMSEAEEKMFKCPSSSEAADRHDEERNGSYRKRRKHRNKEL